VSVSREPRRRTEFSVSWPIQGIFCSRSSESELVLSDVYWLWIYEALLVVRDDGQRLPFVEAIENGFNDPSNLVETVPVTPKLMEVLRQLTPSSAPSFALLVPSAGCAVPTPGQLLIELTRLAGEALSSGTMEMEIE
jgi:hypothetical protein